MKPFYKLLLTVVGLGILGVALVLVKTNPVVGQNRNGAAPVTVENTASEPALVRDVDNARSPFQANCGIRTTSDAGDFTCQLTTVGNGRRLVIETISGFLTVPQSVAPGAPSPFLQTTVNAIAANHYLRSSLETLSGRDTRTFTENVRIYADSGTNVFVKATTDATGTAGLGRSRFPVIQCPHLDEGMIETVHFPSSDQGGEGRKQNALANGDALIPAVSEGRGPIEATSPL